MEEKKQKLYTLFADARKAVERLYTDAIEMLVRRMTTSIARSEGKNKQHMRALLPDEFEQYLENTTLPDAAILAERYTYTVVTADETSSSLLVGNEAREYMQKITCDVPRQHDGISGETASKGVVRGIVRVVRLLAGIERKLGKYSQDTAWAEVYRAHEVLRVHIWGINYQDAENLRQMIPGGTIAPDVDYTRPQVGPFLSRLNKFLRRWRIAVTRLKPKAA